MNELILENDLASIAAKASNDASFLRDLPVDLMRSYQAPAAQIARTIRDNESRLSKTRHGLLDTPDDFVWPKQFHYVPSATGGAHDAIERLHSLQKPKAIPGKTGPRFLLSSDGDAFAALDLKTGETFRGERLVDLPVHYDFLQPLAGIERYVPPSEQQADIDAAKIMRELHDALVAHDPSWKSPERTEALNVFLTRLLFCLFADGAGVFDTKHGVSVANGTHPFKRLMKDPASGKGSSSASSTLAAAFRVLDIRDDDPRRAAMEPLVRALPYANGRLFEADLPVPAFDRRARHALRRALDLDWSQINADIFGSMLQAVASDSDRSHFGMHYTSVSNIMKVIGPLFVDALQERLAKAGQNSRKLRALLDDLAAIHVFDPACGSGNFLIIAYQSLRTIETEALSRLNAVQPDFALRSRVRLDHFHGIDPVDFSCRTARLSLWISQIKADRDLAVAGIAADAILPLHDAGDIRCASALALPWKDIVPTGIGPTYIVGNPPYLGSNWQSSTQKAEMDAVFTGKLRNWRNLDYVAAWFALASEHVAETGSRAAFVSTNSICQGEQVPTLWPRIRSLGVCIGFAHRSFKWSNSAAHNAGVSCVIVGLRRDDIVEPKDVYTEMRHPTGAVTPVIKTVGNINAYLIDGDDVIVEKASKPINGLPEMIRGNQPTDGGHLLLDRTQREELLTKHPNAARLIKPIMGSRELIRGEDRWCLWIPDRELPFATSIPAIAERINTVRATRLASPDPQARLMANRAHQFREMNYSDSTILLPVISSERRLYLQCCIVSNTVASNKCFAVYDGSPWLMAVLSTRMHMVWTMAVGGRMKDDISYLNTIVYNTFPMPNITLDRLQVLGEEALRIIDIRQPYLDEGRNLGWLYNVDTMPGDLLQVHRDLDEMFEEAYIGRRFRDDAERLEHLFRLYTRMKGSTK